MSSVKPATTLVFDSFSGNSLVYLIVLFRQKFPLVSVIVVVGLANLSCCCDHCVNVANKPDKKNVRQRTPPSELIFVLEPRDQRFRGSLSLSLRKAVGGNLGKEVEEIGLTPSRRRTVDVNKLFCYGSLIRKRRNRNLREYIAKEVNLLPTFNNNASKRCRMFL